MSLFTIGGTGLVGSEILKYGIESDNITSIKTVSRRLTILDEKIVSFIESDCDKWLDLVKSNGKDCTTFISSFGTTHSQAGSVDAFNKIDYGINYNLAHAAKIANIDTIILISTAGANQNSWFNYPKSKGKLENDIISLGFKKTIILRPGVLIGDREKPRTAEFIVQKIGSYFYNTPLYFLTFGIKARDLGKLVISLAEKGSVGEKVQIIGPGDVIKLANLLNNSG